MKKSRKKQGDLILVAIGILCLSVFVITGFLLLNYWYESHQQEKLNQQLAELKHGTKGSAMYVQAESIEMQEESGADMGNAQKPSSVNKNNQMADTDIAEVFAAQEEEKGLSQINPDYVMWLQIEETEIDYPVVQRDNSYYLKHDFYGQESKHGTIFLDEKCKKDANFLLLHGHHMKDGTMFGSLKNFKKADFQEQHRTLSLEWENKQESYEIFAGALIDLQQAERFHYEELPNSEETLKTYLQHLKQAAFWYEEPAMEGGERFVILSTCDYGTKEQRLIVVAVEKK